MHRQTNTRTAVNLTVLYCLMVYVCSTLALKTSGSLCQHLERYIAAGLLLWTAGWLGFYAPKPVASCVKEFVVEVAGEVPSITTPYWTPHQARLWSIFLVHWAEV